MLDVTQEDIIRRSVTKNDTEDVRSGGVLRLLFPLSSNYGWNSLSLPSELPPYWSIERDFVLATTVHKEAMWAATIGIAITKMSSMAWEIESDIPLRAKRGQELLLHANANKGWVHFLSQHLRDYLCVSGATRVSLGGDRIGQTKTIREIVNDKDTGPVLSVDRNGSIIERKITDWHTSPLGNRKWWWISLRNSGHCRSNPGGIFVTDDHPILTDSGWISACSVIPGMKVATGDFEPSKEQCELITGALLGDSAISDIRNKATFRFSHCIEQEEWLQFKQKALSGFQWTGYQHVNRKETFIGRSFKKDTTAVCVNSRGSQSLKQWREDWYPEGKKIVAREYIERYFSPRMLATWYCDDGTYHITPTVGGGTHTAKLYTNGFPKMDVEWLVEFLQQKGIDCKVYSHAFNGERKSYYIYITAGGFRTFVDLIGAYIPPCMRYKLPSNAPEFDPSLWSIEPAKTFYSEVVESKQRDFIRGYGVSKTTYNIAVEETENFIAANTVVHNCTDNGSHYEIVRAGKSLGSRIIGIVHLDSRRVTRTGDPQVPVIYRDRLGAYHEMRDYQVVSLADMPDPSETWNGIGLCSASRAYNAIFKLYSIEWLIREKTSGLHPLAIYIVNGLLDKQLQNAVDAAKEGAISRGIAAYMGAVIVPVPSDQTPGMVTIPLAELPDNFNRKEEFDIAILTYANSVGLDIQDIQPLTGQALGTGAQSQVLDEKGKGKGLASWRQQFTHSFNEFVLPELTTMVFVERDYRDMERKAQVSKLRAEVAKTRLESGVTNVQQEITIMIDDDELPKEFMPNDLTPGDTLSDTEKPVTEDPTGEPIPETDTTDLPPVEQVIKEAKNNDDDITKLIEQEKDSAIGLFEKAIAEV